MKDLFGAWLAETRKLQVEYYGNDPAALEGQALRDYIIWNSKATDVELAEMLEESNWKPWAKWSEGDPVIRDQAAYLKEGVDALHFVANLLVAGKITDEMLNASYLAKMEVNRERQRRAGGYISQAGVDKCLSCRRSFDDVGRSSEFEKLCTVCAVEA